MLPTTSGPLFPVSRMLDAALPIQFLKLVSVFGLSLLMVGTSCFAQSPPKSTFFATAAEEAYSTYQMPGNGDLWPSCWADDGNLYTANGDGTAFTGGSTIYDMAVSVIRGMPPSLTGSTIATDVGTNWSGPGYNRKPTGMLCINGRIYLAFQNLNSSNFNDAPAASIAESDDHGVTWIWDTSAPMFGTPGNPGDPDAYKFTTIFFLDFGQNSGHAIDNYVYAYGLDNNWRSQQSLYLARVPATSILDRSTWEFYAGADASGAPLWSPDITQKVPVPVDTRLLYPVMSGTDCPENQAVIAQGGVVYDAPLQRYIFSSWSCATHEFYEAPAPWGPWRHFLSNDFGPLRLPQNRGQYGTSIPSKFISSDGKTLYLQSNVCCSGDSYKFSLRRIYLEPAQTSVPANQPSNSNLAMSPGTRAISKSTHFGLLCEYQCSDVLNREGNTLSEDDYDEETKSTDWWGYLWPVPYNLNQVVYVTGAMFPDGGWFSNNLQVQVRQDFHWADVKNLTISPTYPYSGYAGSFAIYSFLFSDTWGDGVRIIGTPGGASHFTSISQLGVYYASGAAVVPDFELSSGGNITISPGSVSGNTTTISITPSGGFTGSVNLSCAVSSEIADPVDPPVCSIPSSVTIDSQAPQSVTLSISTTFQSASSTLPSRSFPYATADNSILVFALIWVCFGYRRPTRKLYRLGIIFIAIFGAGCGGSSSNIANNAKETSPGPYKVTITGTSGAITRTTIVEITVN